VTIIAPNGGSIVTALAIVEQLEAARATAVEEIKRLDAALAALRGEPQPDGRPVKKAADRGAQSVRHLAGKRTGRAPSWDTAKARRLYDQGRTFPEIAAAVGSTEKSVGGYARRNGWPARGKGFHRTKGGPGRPKCKACGSTVTPGETCPACGIPA